VAEATTANPRVAPNPEDLLKISWSRRTQYITKGRDRKISIAFFRQSGEIHPPNLRELDTQIPPIQKKSRNPTDSDEREEPSRIAG
jgi:hypothetical protein